MTTLVAALCAAGAIALLLPLRPRPAPDSGGTWLDERRDRADEGLLRRHRLLSSLLCGAAVAVVVGGPAGSVGAVVGAIAAWITIGRSESPRERRRRAEVARDLPAVVTLVAAALRSGAAPGEAVLVVSDALPGAAAERLRPVVARLRLGVPDPAVWAEVARDRDLAPLGRTLARAHDTGAPVVAAVERLADDLARESRAGVEDRARAVGVKAAVPLGLCLLPAFVLIGIVPLVAGLIGSLGW